MTREPLFTPSSAREMHRKLTDWWGSVHGQAWAEKRNEHSDTDYFAADNERRRLAASETFLVTDEMSAVCRAAAASLPSLVFTRDVPPSKLGFVVFNDRLADHEGDSCIPVQAVAWRPEVHDAKAGIVLTTYLLPESAVDLDGDDRWAKVHSMYRYPMLPALWTFVPYGEEPPAEAVADKHMEYAVRMCVATWRLMRQPLVARSPMRLSRTDVKRMTRSGMTGDLSVIMLRQSGGPTAGRSTREYRHRWLVRGHWRRLPPANGQERVTWIHGYVKGPTDAPLLVRDRVTVLAR
jgi:hypothetical protein